MISKASSAIFISFFLMSKALFVVEKPTSAMNHNDRPIIGRLRLEEHLLSILHFRYLVSGTDDKDDSKLWTT